MVFLLGVLVLASTPATQRPFQTQGMLYYLLTLRRPARASLPAG